MIVVAIIISLIAVLFSLLAFLKVLDIKDQTNLRFRYTKKGIVFYDKEGKEILIKSEKL